MLPKIIKIKELPIFTPTKWQTVLLRNYGLVKNSKLASVLRTDEQTIYNEAVRLGIEKIAYDQRWIKSGYITIVKANWHLLPYSQLIEILDTTEEVLDYNLREDDFLGIKLGEFKPYCEEVVYQPLTAKQIEKTEELSKIIKENFIENYTPPFEFLYDEKLLIDSKDNDKDFEKIVYAYSATYGDAFLSDGEIIPESLLKRLSKTGVNGIWFQGVLSKLSPYPFIEGVDLGYERRRANVNKLIDKCAEYGIKVYLYFNEPRGLEQEEFTEETAKLKGREYGGKIALCTSKSEVKEYLYSAFKDFLSSVPNLGGIITITASENLTNCFARPGNDCKDCLKRGRPEVVSEVNNIIMHAIKDSSSNAKMIANLWGWAEYIGWTKEEVYKGISLLDKDIAVMCVSEMGTIIKDGKPFRVAEYSLSHVGPCQETIEYLAYAKELGHKIMAKVQINNTWEISTIPYFPVYDLIVEHMLNLKKIEVSGLMLSWTLGGYPSASFNLVNQIFSDDFSYDNWLKSQYQDKWEVAKKGVSLLSKAFRNYPICTGILYYSAVHMGASNLWYKEPTELLATMVCYPYDDIEGWCLTNSSRSNKDKTFTNEEFKQKLKKLTDEWLLGLDLLNKESGNSQFEELKLMARGIYLNIKSLLVQFEFNELKQSADKKVLLDYIDQEEKLTLSSYLIASKDARIGFEASNHYAFTQNTFLEKLVNLKFLRDSLK